MKVLDTLTVAAVSLAGALTLVAAFNVPEPGLALLFGAVGAGALLFPQRFVSSGSRLRPVPIAVQSGRPLGPQTWYNHPPRPAAMARPTQPSVIPRHEPVFALRSLFEGARVPVLSDPPRRSPLK